MPIDNYQQYKRVINQITRRLYMHIYIYIYMRERERERRRRRKLDSGLSWGGSTVEEGNIF